MTQPCRPMHLATDEWSISTVEVPLPSYQSRQREPLLVELPCPPMPAAACQPTDFECEVIETAELARYQRLPPQEIRARARRYAWGCGVASLLAIGSVPVAIWVGTVPVALAAGFGWQCAVLRAAARRLERNPTPS